MHPTTDYSPSFRAFLVCVLSALVSAFDLVADLLLGWTIKKGGRRERRLAEEEYDKSAQVR